MACFGVGAGEITFRTVSGVVLVVAVVEVLVPGIVRIGCVLRPVVLPTSPCRRFAPISGETAPDRSWLLPAVSVVRMAVAS